MLSDESRRAALAEAGFERVSGHFTVERMVARTAAVYRRLNRGAHPAGTERAATR
jgi:hypothetical protein